MISKFRVFKEKNFTTHNPTVPKTNIESVSAGAQTTGEGWLSLQFGSIHPCVWCQLIEFCLNIWVFESQTIRKQRQNCDRNLTLTPLKLVPLVNMQLLLLFNSFVTFFYILLWSVLYITLITRRSRSVSGTILNHSRFFLWTYVLLCCVFALYMCGLFRITFRTGSRNHLCVPLFIASLSWLLCRDPPLFNQFYFPLSH